MKKVLLLILALTLLFVPACTKDGPEIPPETAETTETVSTPPLRIMENGESLYAIVRGENARQEEIEVAIFLRKQIEEKTGVILKIQDDWENERMNIVRGDYEIVIGKTNRSDGTEDIRYSDYGWKIVDKRVHIFGGSPESLQKAVDTFLERCVSESGISVEAEGFAVLGDYPMRDGSVGGIPFADLETVLCYDSETKALGEVLAQAIANVSGKYPEVKTGKTAEGAAIVLGCSETDARIADLGDDEVLFLTEGNQLLITANGRYGFHRDAVNTFISEILGNKQYSEALSITLPLQYEPVTVVADKIPANPRALPADVAQTPYRESQFTTVYAPWLRQYHFMSLEDYENGLNGGEASQQIRALTVSPVDPDIMYCVTNTNGIWKTEDGGKLWFNTTNNCTGAFGLGILCDQNDRDTVYAYMRQAGAFKSTDGGKTWMHLLEDSSRLLGYASRKITQDKAGNVYFAAADGIYKMAQGSNTLVNLYSKFSGLTGADSAAFSDIYVSEDGQNLYVGNRYISSSGDVCKPGLYVSTDGGKTWTVRSVSEKDLTSVFSVTLDPENANHIVLSGRIVHADDKSEEDCRLYESFDGGKTFTELYTLRGSSGAKDMYQLEYGPKNEDGVRPLYVIGDLISFPHRRSVDGGKTFSSIYDRIGVGTFRGGKTGTGSTGYYRQPYVLDMTKPDTFVFAGSGINRYSDGEQEWIGSGYSGICVIRIYMDEQGNMLLAVTDRGTIVSTTPYTADSYATFTGKDTKTLTRFAIDPADSMHVIGFSGSSNTPDKTEFGIVESFDGGMTFTEILPGTETGTVANPHVFAYSATDPNTVISSYMTSRDNGKTWEKNDYYIYAISENNPEKMVGYPMGGDPASIWVTVDGGKKWSMVLTHRSPDKIQFDLADDNKVWFIRLYEFGYIDLTTNQYVPLSGKIGYSRFSTFAQNPNNPQHMIVATRSYLSDTDPATNPALVESVDGGKTWYTISGMAFGSYVSSICFSTTTDEVFLTGLNGTLIYDYQKYWDYLKK